MARAQLERENFTLKQGYMELKMKVAGDFKAKFDITRDEEDGLMKCVGCGGFSRKKKNAVNQHLQGCTNCGIPAILSIYCQQSFSQKNHFNTHLKEDHR